MGSKYTSARRNTSPQPDTVRCRSFIRRESSIDQARLVARIAAITGWDYRLRFQGLDGCSRETSTRLRSRMRRFRVNVRQVSSVAAQLATGRSSSRRFLPFRFELCTRSSKPRLDRINYYILPTLNENISR